MNQYAIIADAVALVHVRLDTVTVFQLHDLQTLAMVFSRK